MSEIWLTPQQIASMRLVHMPTHEVSIRRMCQKNLLVHRSKERGKGIEIALSSLPPTSQRDYYARIARSAVSGGESIQAGTPSPADTSPAANGAGGLAGGGGAVGPATGGGACGIAGGGTQASLPQAAPSSAAAEDGQLLMGTLLAARGDAARMRAEEAHRRYTIIEPILSGQIAGRAAIARHAQAHGKTAATLYRWVALYRRGGARALADAPRRDANRARALIGHVWEAAARAAGISADARAEIARRMVEVVRGLWAQTTQPSAAQVAHLARPELVRLSVAAGMDEPMALRVCRLPRRFVNGERRWNLVALADRDAKGFYDRVIPAIRRSRKQLDPGDVVFGDVSPADIPVERPDGSIGWARLIAWRDAATNMWHITGYMANPGAGVRREHVALAFAAMCADAPWGMPRRLYLDNGSEFNWVEMIEAWSALAKFSGGLFAGCWGTDALGEDGRIWRTEPYKPRAKLIEGGFGNFLRYMGWHPCFAGSDRLTKKTRALGRPIEPTTLQDLKQFLAQAVQYYHGVPQSGFLGGLSPVEKLEQAIERGWRRVTVDTETLALAFSEVCERRVRAGQVEVGGWYYYHQSLIGWTGERVIVRWARHAPDAAYVFDPRTRALLCVALPMPVFQFADPDGAKHAARLAKEAREAVSVMRGQVAWLEPRDLMGEFARLARVEQVIERSRDGERRIEVSDEARAMLEARNQAVLAALARAAPADPGLVANRHGVVDEEAEAFRLWLDSSDQNKGAAA